MILIVNPIRINEMRIYSAKFLYLLIHLTDKPVIALSLPGGNRACERHSVADQTNGVCRF